jgi:hypothetical protein
MWAIAREWSDRYGHVSTVITHDGLSREKAEEIASLLHYQCGSHVLRWFAVPLPHIPSRESEKAVLRAYGL